MPAYVTLPGTSGTYFSTADVNVLPSNDAHFHQSVGNWTAGAGASTLAHDTGGTPTPQFGDGTAKATTDGTGAVIASLTTPSLTAAEHTVSIDIYTSTASREAFITLDGTDGTVTALTAGTWTRLSATKTVTTGTKTVTVTYRNVNDSDPAASEEVWLDQACLRSGTSSTFLPTLRIVGDLDVEFKGTWDSGKAGSQVWAFGTYYGGGTPSGWAIRKTTLDRLGLIFIDSGGTARGAEITAGNPASDTVFTYRAQLTETSGTTSNVDQFIDGIEKSVTSVLSGYGWPPTHTNNRTLFVGAEARNVQHWAGDIYYVIVRDGIDGPVVARFDADDWVGV